MNLALQKKGTGMNTIRMVIILCVILATAVVDMLGDVALGVDLSHLSRIQRILHNLVYKLTGAAIFAAALWA